MIDRIPNELLRTNGNPTLVQLGIRFQRALDGESALEVTDEAGDLVGGGGTPFTVASCPINYFFKSESGKCTACPVGANCAGSSNAHALAQTSCDSASAQVARCSPYPSRDFGVSSKVTLISARSLSASIARTVVAATCECLTKCSFQVRFQVPKRLKKIF